MNKRILDMLTRLAIDGEGVSNGRVRMSAGIVYRKHLIATGVNQMKTHPLMMGKGYRKDQLYMHAEVDAIRNALRLITPAQLTQCELYVVRVKRPHIGSSDWIHGLAKPCPGCASTIAGFGISNIHLTEDEDNYITA